MEQRSAGKLGRLPGQIPVGLRDLTWYIAGALPKAPASVAVPEVAWGMLGNDQYGDCGVAGLEHVFMADAAATREQESEADAEQAISYYLNYTGGQDSGVVLAKYLGYVRQHGYYGREVKAYAPVTVNDIPTLQTSVWMYGAAYTGIVVTTAMQQAFGSHEPWTVSLLESPIAGGHCVPIVGFDDQYLYVITWGGVQAVTYSCWHQIASEAWAVITGEFVSHDGDGRGISLDALNADLDLLAS